jgi:hypothetical protein
VPLMGSRSVGEETDGFHQCVADGASRDVGSTPKVAHYVNRTISRMPDLLLPP